VTRTQIPEFIKDYYTGKPGQAILDYYADLERAKVENLRRLKEGMQVEGLAPTATSAA
jgi:hypothetical protein